MSQSATADQHPDRVAVKGGEQYPPEASLKLNGPPGTGKTTQLLERVTRLLDSGVELNDITFVTYRTEMAEEFLRRLRDRGYVTDEQIEEPWAHETRHFGTLHAVCNRITIDAQTVENKHRRHFLWDEYKVQYDGRRADLDTETDFSAKVGSLVFDAYSWCIENKQFSFPRFPGYMEIKDEWPNCPSFQEFDKAWTDYKEDGGTDGAQLQDFEDMLRKVDVQNLAAPGDILIVDEYHDFTPIMASIVNGWMDRKDTVIVGADPLQAIYSYKGASPEFYRQLDLPEILLDRTYRVPSNVWEYARGVIDHTPPDIEPNRDGGKVTAAKGTPKDVVDKYGSEGSLMFLARTKSQVRDISNKLKEAGVVFRSQKRAGGWNHSTKRLPLYNALQKIRDVRPVESVNPSTGQTGMNRYTDEDVEKGVRIPSAVELTPSEMKALVRFTPAEYFTTTKKSLKTVPDSQPVVTGDDLLQHVEPSFWGDMTNGSQSVQNLLSYDAKDIIKRALIRNDEPFDSIATADIPDVMTIHASKGKEADTVALYDGIPPAVQKDTRRDERKQRAESRVWYVGVTRAAENLLVFRDEYDYCDPILPSIR